VSGIDLGRTNRRGWVHALAALAVLGGLVVLVDHLVLTDALPAGEGRTFYRADIVADPSGGAGDTVRVVPLAGPRQGQTLQAAWDLPEISAGPPITRGRVFVEFDADGRAFVRGVARDRTFLALTGGLLGLIAVIAAGSAWRLLGVLLAGFGCLVGVLVPLLLAGAPPIAAAALTGLTLLVVSSLLIGRSARVRLGIFVGAFGGLAIAAGLAVLAVAAGRLTGVYSSLTKDLWFHDATRGLNFRDLLCAGMIVGTCGIILDLAAAVASAIDQVAQADPSLGRRRLAAAGLAVGRDVMGTELNTLIFAYGGAHLGVVLLPMLAGGVPGHEIPALRVFSHQPVAIEILQMLVGTIALVLTIPITAAASAMLTASPAPRPARPATSARLGRIVPWVAVGAVLLGAWVAAAWWHGRAYHRYGPRRPGQRAPDRYIVQARVVSAKPPPEAFGPHLSGERLQTLECTCLSGPVAGQDVTVPNAISGFPGHDKLLGPGDRALLQVWADDGRVTYATVLEFSRGRIMIHLAAVLVAVVLVVGRRHGARALAALVFSGAVLYPAVVAAAAWQWKALPTFLAASVPLCVGVFIILVGPGRKAVIGSAGAFGGLLVGGVCAVFVAAALGLTGLASDAMAAVRMFTKAPDMDYRGLLQAGMVLGIVGAAMDVAIAIASAVDQVRAVKPEATRGELLARGLAVGRGIMIPMVLVLVFAYVGLNLPILALPRTLPGRHLAVLVSNERIAVEVLRILVGGIGVAVTVPVTAALAALLAGRAKTRSHATPPHVHPDLPGP